MGGADAPLVEELVEIGQVFGYDEVGLVEMIKMNGCELISRRMKNRQGLLGQRVDSDNRKLLVPKCLCVVIPDVLILTY